MSNPVSRVAAMPAPATAVTLAQTEILAPVVLAIATVLVAGIDRLVRLLGRG